MVYILLQKSSLRIGDNTSLTPNHDIWWMSILSWGSFWRWGITGEGKTRAKPKLKLPKTAENTARKSRPFLKNSLKYTVTCGQLSFRKCYHTNAWNRSLTIHKAEVSHLIWGVWLFISGVVSSGWCAISPLDHIQTEQL